MGVVEWGRKNKGLAFFRPTGNLFPPFGKVSKKKFSFHVSKNIFTYFLRYGDCLCF